MNALLYQRLSGWVGTPTEYELDDFEEEFKVVVCLLTKCYSPVACRENEVRSIFVHVFKKYIYPNKMCRYSTPTRCVDIVSFYSVRFSSIFVLRASISRRAHR